MLPVVASLEETRTQMFLYAASLLPVSLLLFFIGASGWLYAAVAAVLGLAFAARTWQLRSDTSAGAAMGVFRFSIYYLALIFVAVAADTLLLG
jgi:protoheme IX farnesyltransferase